MRRTKATLTYRKTGNLRAVAFQGAIIVVGLGLVSYPAMSR